MTDNTFIRDYYEHQPYPDEIFHFTHPAHMGALAQLYGHPGAVDPTKARILEIGCGSGANLRRIAHDLPEATCLGLDLAQIHIDKAHLQVNKEGLKNIEFHRADILQYNFSGQRFDYIIAHGFFSWVPDEVKDCLLLLCRDHLSSKGLAMLSYNCLPGWSVPQGLRLLMQMENETQENKGRETLQVAEQVRNFFAKTLPAVKQMPHAPQLHHEIENLRYKNPEIILHDELEPLNTPLYLLEFAQSAQDAELAYVGDTMLLTDWLEVYPKIIKQALTEYAMSRMRALQYVDFLMNRKFRRSLICPIQIATQLHGKPSVKYLQGLWVASRLRLDKSKKYKAKGKMIYRFIPETTAKPSASEKMQVSNPLIQSFLNILAENLGQFQPIEKVYIIACRQSKMAENNKNWMLLGQFILNAVAQNFLKVSLGGSNH